MIVLGNRYEVLQSVGSGAAAVVYKVRDQHDDSVKVAKLLRAESASNQETVRRFEDEFRILRGLHHPSLPEVYDYGWTTDQSRYMVMEYVEGQPLDQYVAEHPQDLWVILYQLCEVLSFIHSHNLLHQDIKPGNILVKRTSAYGDEMPLCVLIDFGLTFRRDAGDDVVMVGTPEYMAPEIIRGDAPLTRAVDYYGLGVTLYQLITGELPFTGTGRDVFDGHLNRPVQFKREKVEYAELYPHIRGLMTKDKRARLQAFEDFKRAIIGRLTGGISELEQAYGLARINSLGMIGKDKVWKELMDWLGAAWIKENLGAEIRFPIAVVAGAPGSGTSYIAERAAFEAKIRGARVVFSDRGGRRRINPDAYWDQFASAPRSPVLLVIDDFKTSNTEDAGLLDYIRRRQVAEAASENDALAFATIVVSNEVGVSEFVANEMQCMADLQRVPIPPLRKEDRENIVSAFRGGVLDKNDAEEIAHMLSEVGHSPEASLRSLQSAVVTNALRFSAGRWVAKIRLRNVTSSGGTYYVELVRSLPSSLRDAANLVACARRPLLLESMSIVLEHEPQAIPVLLTRLKELGVIDLENVGVGIAAKYVSDVIRKHVYAAVPQEQRHRFHVQLLQLAVTALQTDADVPNRANLYGDASAHQCALEEYSHAIRMLLRGLLLAIKQYRLTDARELADLGYYICEQWHTAGGDPAHLRRYITKLMLNAYWKRSTHDAIRSLIECEYGEDGETVPVSFVSKYARALQYTGDATRAKDLLVDRMKTVSVASQSFLHMDVERAMLQRDAAPLSKAISDLNEVIRLSERMTPYYRCRALVNLAICHDANGEFEKALESAEKAESIAREYDYDHELSVVLQARANAAFAAHRLSLAMSYIADGVRLTTRRKLHNSRKWFYFQASAVYYERGDLERCSRYLGRARNLAQKLGDLDTVVIALVRAAMVAQLRGEYSNTIRYLDRADDIAGAMPGYQTGTDLHLLRFEVELDLNSNELDKKLEILTRLMSDEVRPNRLGHFQLLRGHYFRSRGDAGLSRSCYESSMKLFDDAGQKDDRVRATLALASAELDEGNLKRVDEIAAEAEQLLAEIDNKGLDAEYAALQLRRSILARKLSYSDIERCENMTKGIVPTLSRMLVDAQLFEGWRYVGDEVRASEAFERFYREVKRVVANLSSREMTNTFLARPEIAQTLRAYQDGQ